MAEPLKNSLGPALPKAIAAQICAVHPGFQRAAFLKQCLAGYDDLDLMARGRRIATALAAHLPQPFDAAIEVLLSSLGPKLENTEDLGLTPFFYLPHVCFVAQFGLDHFEPSMRAQYELTQRFTAEFSIRAFLERNPAATLARLKTWASDPNVHVRRLVSEGTRPRLPWAQRLPQFQRDPAPVLALLELLKDDAELYVRRSVANNLNDIGKDHPQLLVATARNWLRKATPHRRWLINHALRSAVKRAEPGALAVLGYGHSAQVSVHDASLTPRNAVIGEALRIAFAITNSASQPQRLLVDFRIHYVKASGKTSAKVFKLKAVSLAPGQTETFSKKISLAEMTTRKHYPGTHKVDVVINGNAQPLGAFRLNLTRSGKI